MNRSIVTWLLGCLLIVVFISACGGTGVGEVTRVVEGEEAENENAETGTGETDADSSSSDESSETEPEIISTEFSGCVWEDRDGDGLKGEIEPGVQGAEIFVIDGVTEDLSIVNNDLTTSTGQDGCYKQAFNLVDPAGAWVEIFPLIPDFEFTGKNTKGGDRPDDSDVDEFGEADNGKTVVWAGLLLPEPTVTEEESAVEATTEIWPYIYRTSDETRVDISTIDLSELEDLDINDIELGYDPETNEIFFDVGFNAEEAQTILMGLDFAGEDLQQAPTEPPLVLTGGFNSTFGVAIQNGEPVANIRGIYTGNEIVLTESAVTGDFFGSTATMRLPANLIPFSTDSIRGGVGDGTFFAPFQPLEDNGGWVPLDTLLGSEDLERMRNENREQFCSPTTNTCIGLRVEWDYDANSNIIKINFEGAEATLIHGINTETADERWQVFLGQGWEDTGAPDTYGSVLYDWVIHTLSSNGTPQGYVALSENNGFTYELSLQAPNGLTAEVSKELFLGVVDTFRGPASQ